MTRPASRSRPRPSGFTLVELLVVLVIIAVLIALLVPAIMGAIRNARGAAVQAEINQMVQALADFKSKMGDYPPSRIILNESGNFPTGATAVPSPGYTDVTVGQLGQRTVTAFRKFWPRVAVSTSGPIGTFAQGTQFYDFNGDGAFQGNTSFVLMGPECLAFFLGGIPSVDLTGGRFIGMTGFGKNPTNPFSNNIASEPRFGRGGAPSVMYNANRNPSFFEFAGDRLVANSSSAGLNSGVGYFPGYLDSLGSSSAVPPQNFYAFFSTNLGIGYDPNDCNALNPVESDTTLSTGNNPIALTFASAQPVYAPPTAGATPGSATQSPSPNPYTTSAPSGTTNITYQNAQSFQIISGGNDGLYGVGGIYSPNSTNGVLPTEHGSGGTYPLSNSTDPSLRLMERDNLTNFHNGRLD
ncbi:MAG: prepilin-type N-terminal cleavage/methylation domain-containing protein [Isosphaeraceae bacterium]